MRDHHRAVERLGEQGLVEPAKIVAADERRGVLRAGARHHFGAGEDVRGRVIRQARERPRDRLELGGVPFERLQLEAAAVERPRDQADHELLGELEEVRELGEGDLRLDHPELGQMTARLRFLRPEGGTEAVDLPERHAGRLEVKLSRLAQVGLVAEIIGLEQRRGPLAGGRGQDGRIDQHEITLVKEVPDRLGDLAPDFQQGVLLRRAQPEMPVVEQEVGTMLLGADRVVNRLLQQREPGQAHLVSARSALVLPDPADHIDGRFLGRLRAGREDGGVDLRLKRDGLQVSAAVAKDQELELPLFATVVDPATDSDLLALVEADLPDGGQNHDAPRMKRAL